MVKEFLPKEEIAALIAEFEEQHEAANKISQEN